MTAYSDPVIHVIKQTPCFESASDIFTQTEAREALRFHQSLPSYRITDLVSLTDTAKLYQVGAILVKDESSRFGLKAFKGLGGSYSMFRILCEKLSLDPRTTDYGAFLDEDIRQQCQQVEFVTATDGNHGKGISWAAKLFGCKAHVLMPKGSVEIRRRAIEEAGSAVAEITDFNYDQTVQLAASLAEKHGWVLIQDTAWDGYEMIPTWIIEGYLSLIEETVEQMNGLLPTHVFLQAGVGAMAGGLTAYLINRFPKNRPAVAIVEPRAADCIFESVSAGDGMARSVSGNPVTIMAGLNCGTPCKVVWPILRDCSTFFCTCEDSVTEAGMRSYAYPTGNDLPVVSGESGAVTYGCLLSILRSEELRNLFEIHSDSVLLLINTEGATDPEGYARIVM